MARNSRSKPFLYLVGLFLMSAIPFIVSTHGQQTDSATQIQTAEPQSPKHVLKDRPIEHFTVTNADIRSVIKQLSEFAGSDLVLSEKATGTISLTLSDKTWREILGVICTIKGFTVVKEPSYIYILPTEDFRKQQLDNVTLNQQTEAVEDLHREVLKISNVTAMEMSNAIKSLMSTRGKITVVERNNALIIFDSEKNLEQIRKTVKELDVETDQISISCKIIEASSGVLNSIGVRWGYFDQVAGAQANAVHLPGDSNVITKVLEQVAYGIMGQDKFAFTLQYMLQNNKAEMVAQPQITTLDNKEAKIFMGSQVPITYKDEMSTNTLVKMVDAGTEMTVTPHITSDKRIMLALYPRKRSYTLTNGQPIINEQSAQTNVVVSDGETVVIAGLTSNEKQHTEEGIPILKDIPLIGNLFKRTSKVDNKDDLIVFVTPHIINKKIESAASAK